MAAIFVSGGLDAFRTPAPRAQRAGPVAEKLAGALPLPEDPEQLVKLNAAVHVVFGSLLALDKLPRLSAAVLAASLVPTTVGGHRFWEEQDPQKKAQQRIHFFKNTSMLGGLLLAAVDTEGKPGVAWRARRAAADVRREAKGLARSARREAKLARAQLT